MRAVGKRPTGAVALTAHFTCGPEVRGSVSAIHGVEETHAAGPLAAMKFGIVMRDELKACLVGAKIEMFDFFVDYKRLKKLLRHLVRALPAPFAPAPRALPATGGGARLGAARTDPRCTPGIGRALRGRDAGARACLC